MANISPKLFQKAIQTGLKTALFTTSTAALMLSSSGALGAALDVTGNIAALQVGDATNLSAPWANADSLKLTGPFNINTGGDVLDIAGVNINGNAGQLFTVAHDQITIIGGALAMNLTLTNAAGDVTVGSVGAGDVRVAGGVLGIGAAGQDMIITGGTVNQSAAIVGDLTVSNGGIYVGTAAANVGGEVDVQADAGAVTIHNATGNVTVAGSTLAINNADADMTITGGTVNQSAAIVGDLTVSNGGIYVGTAAANVGGEVDVQADAGAVTIHNATGNVTVAGSTLAINNADADMTITGGTVNQTGAVAGDLDVSNGGKYVGTAAANITGTVNVQAGAGAVTINNAIGNVTVAGSTLAIVDAGADMTITGGQVNQTGDIGGNLAMSNGGVLNGTAGATNVGGTVLLNAGFAGQVTINNANGLVTTKSGTLTLNNAANGINFAAGAAAGTTVNIIGGGNAGDVDNTTGGNTIGTITFKGIGTANDIGATNSLAVVNVGGGEVTINGAVMQADAINLTNDASELTFTNPVIVTGAIDNTGNANNGIATFTGASTVTGNIGNTAALAEVSVGAGLLQVQGGVVKANAINLTNDASELTFTNPVIVTGAIDNTGNANNGIATFTGASTVTGNIGNTAALAEVSVGAGLLQVQGGVVKANAINLTNDASELTFTNPVIVTGAIDNTGNANNGIATFTGASTVTGNIGNTAALAEVSVGAGLLQVQGGVVKANAINLTNDASELTFTNPVIVTGAIDNTGNANNGIATFTGASTVTGNIGNTAALAEVSVGAGLLQVQGGVVKANAINLTNDASELTFTNPVIVTGAIDNTGNANNGIATFTGASTVTGNIGNTAALAEVSVGAGLLQVQGGVVKANAINLTNDASELTFTNPVIVTGAIDNTGNANNGIATFTGASTVTGNIGNTAALAEVSVGAGLLQVQGGVVKANAINLTNDASELTFTNPVIVTGAIDNTGNANNGIATFTGASTVTGNIGNTAALAEVSVGAGLLQVQGGVVKANAINLTNDASELTFTNPVIVTGAIDNTGNTGNGIVTFTGNSTVTGSIGGTELFATVNVGAGITLQAGGSLGANNIDFGAGSILEFNGAGKSYNLIRTIANGNNATLNINAVGTVVANDASIGTVAQINIQNGKTFVINAKSANVDILDAQVISFKGAGSRLFLANVSTTDDRVITLKNHLPGLANGGGELILFSPTKLMTVQGDGGAKTIGTAGNALASLSVLGNVELNNIDATNVPIFNILGPTDFVDVGGITNQINIINIGAAGVGPTGVAIAAADGSYTIDANGGGVGILANGQTINFAHVDAELVLQNSAAGDGTITLNAILDPGAPAKGKLVVDSGANAGKIILASVGGATYGTAINRLQELEFRGNGEFQIDTDIFANDLELSVAAIDYNKNINSNLSFGDTTKLNLNGNINGDVDFNNQAAVITLANGNNITGSVKSSNGVNGTIIASGASTIKGPITNLAMLKVGVGAVSITQGGDTSITEIQGNGTALLTLPADFKLTGAINATGGQALKLNFTNGGSVSGIVGKVGNEVGDITTAGAMSFASSVNAKGTATFGGNTSFADTFTNTGAVTLAKDSINNFAKDVKATSFVANGAAMNFGNSLAFNSDITGSGTTLTLGANQVTYTGTGSFTDTLTLNTTFDGAAKSGGNILIKSGSTLDLSGVSTLALAITAVNFDINDIDEDTKYTVISAETAGGLKPTPAGNVKITVNNDNRFVDFTFDASTLTLFAEDIAGDVIDEDFEPGGPLANISNAANIKKSLELMEDAPNGSDARQAFADWGNLTPIQEADAVTHLMQNVVKPSEVVAACSQAISGNILGNLTSINTRINTAQAAAVAAGDEDMDAKFGGWINPFVGNATQKKIQNISGYKSDTTGGTLGFDSLINDDAVLGLAYTRAETDVKLKDAKSGDKNKVRSNIFSVYGLYNLPQSNFFVEGVASYGDSKVTSKSRRVISTGLETVGYQTANGKYKSENYTGQLMAGYNYALPETVSAMPLVVTPMAGVRYSDIKDKGYKETGTTYQNLLVKGKNYNTFDGLLGAKVSSNINVSEVVLTPELYAMVDYAFKNKAPAIDARLQGMAAPFPTNSFKPKKTSFDVGVGVTAKHKMMEYGINYDTNIGSKYFAQQGSVKVRVNF